MPPDPPRGYRLRRAFIRTPLRQILGSPQVIKEIQQHHPYFDIVFNILFAVKRN